MKAEDLKVGRIYKVAEFCSVRFNLFSNSEDEVIVDSMVIVKFPKDHKTVTVNLLENECGRLYYCCYMGEKVELTLDMEYFLKKVTQNKVNIPLSNTKTKNGIVVEFANGGRACVVNNCFYDYQRGFLFDISIFDERLRVIPYQWNNKMRYREEYDIVKIYKQKQCNYITVVDNTFYIQDMELIWKREPIKTMTQTEIEKELGYKIKIEI